MFPIRWLPSSISLPNSGGSPAPVNQTPPGVNWVIMSVAGWVCENIDQNHLINCVLMMGIYDQRTDAG